MPRYTIPEHPGRFHVEQHYSGRHYLVMNDKTGKNQVCFPVAGKAEADEWCRRLNAGEHNGTISVPALER
jgi:hypothetical protein